MHLQLESCEYKNSDEILTHDKSFIFQIIAEHFNSNEFEDCFVLQNILEVFDWLKIDYSKEIKKEYKSELYKLTEVLKRDRHRKRELGWEEEEKLHEKELLDYCLNFKIDKYMSLFKNVALILKRVTKLSRGNTIWQYESSLNTIFGNLAQTDKNLFLIVLRLNFEEFRFNLNFTYIFNRLFQVSPQFYYEVFEVIKDYDVNIKFCFHQALMIDSVRDEHILTLYSDLLVSIKSLTTQYIFWDLAFVSKYQRIKVEEDIYTEILEIILAKIKNENINISVGERFIEKCTTFNRFSVEMLTEAYLFSRKIEQHFDYDKRIFKILLQRDSNILIKLLKFKTSDRMSYHDLEHENFDFIWEFDNYEEILNSIFEYFISNKTYYMSERAVAAFFPESSDKHGDKPIDYLKEIFKEKNTDEEYIEMVFSIICYKYSNHKMEFLEIFLEKNSDFDVFRNLEIIPRSQTWSGSRIPILEREKETWNEVLSIINRLPSRLDFYEHKEYVSRKIAGCDSFIKEEMKREFFEDFR